MADPALDQPQLEEYDDIDGKVRYPHTNGELHFAADRDSDLYDLRWHWHRRAYARSIRIRIDAPIYTSSGISSEQLDDVLPLAVQLYPGYQETIYGVEGVIVSKRIFAPLDGYYDRSLLWMMEAQAEGDRLIQIRVEIDWGEPLEQRMVDGLLVAQKDPGEAKGAHGQRNAESTRVFGAAEGRPDLVDFPTDSQAHLVYHVLVAGQVDLPLILTLSDVGEQVAWNGFLVQRDISRAFKRGRTSWRDLTHRGGLWSPDVGANQAVQQAKIGAVQSWPVSAPATRPPTARSKPFPAWSICSTPSRLYTAAPCWTPCAGSPNVPAAHSPISCLFSLAARSTCQKTAFPSPRLPTWRPFTIICSASPTGNGWLRTSKR